MDKVAELITANDALRACNAALENNCKGLMEELSIKEAQWSEREESLKLEVEPPTPHLAPAHVSYLLRPTLRIDSSMITLY